MRITPPTLHATAMMIVVVEDDPESVELPDVPACPRGGGDERPGGGGGLFLCFSGTRSEGGGFPVGDVVASGVAGVDGLVGLTFDGLPVSIGETGDGDTGTGTNTGSGGLLTTGGGGLGRGGGGLGLVTGDGWTIIGLGGIGEGVNGASSLPVDGNTATGFDEGSGTCTGGGEGLFQKSNPAVRVTFVRQ